MQAVPASRSAVVRSAAIAVAFLAVLLAACGSDATGPRPIDVDWVETAEAYRGQIDRRVTYRCPPDGEVNLIWGTDVYTDDSSVCTAAVHAGRITLAQGGTVTFRMRPGQSSYTSSTRNGVTSEEWDDWDTSFIFP